MEIKMEVNKLSRLKIKTDDVIVFQTVTPMSAETIKGVEKNIKKELKSFGIENKVMLIHGMKMGVVEKL